MVYYVARIGFQYNRQAFAGHFVAIAALLLYRFPLKIISQLCLVYQQRSTSIVRETNSLLPLAQDAAHVTCIIYQRDDQLIIKRGPN